MGIFSQLNNKTYLNTGLTALMGLLLIIFPQAVGGIIAYVIGAFLIAAGVIDVINFISSGKEAMSYTIAKAIGGGIKFILGIYCISHPSYVVSLISIIFGIFIAIKGVGQLQNALTLKKITSGESWIGSFVFALALLIAAVVIFINPFALPHTIARVIGIFLLVTSLAEAYTLLQTKKNESNVIREGRGPVVDGEYREL